MSVLISGSLAYDMIFRYPGRFSEVLRCKDAETLNLTFEAADVQRSFGGCAGNIAYSLRQLGGDPYIFSTLGADAEHYLRYLRQHDIRTDGISICSDEETAKCLITIDAAHCQLATFLPGVINRAASLPYPKKESLEYAILAPTAHEPLLRHADLLLANGIPFVLDMGQTTPLFSADEMVFLTGAASMVIFSDYEETLVKAKIGKTAALLSEKGTPVICTHGASGSSLWINGQETTIESIPAHCADPVGAGDAYRGGLLWGLSRALPPLVCARMGSIMGALKVSAVSTNYKTDIERVRSIYEKNWGPAPF